MANFLVVDDNLIMRKTIKSILESIGHKVIEELKDGSEIIAKYNDHQPDVITLDLVMPQVDGLETLKKLKNSHPEVKVMIVTCSGKKSEILQALNLGADYYIEKPFSIEDLIKALNNLLDVEKSDNGCNCSCEEVMLGKKLDSKSNRIIKKDTENRLKEELESFKKKDNDSLEDKLDDIAAGLDEGKPSKPIEVFNEEGVLKIKINKEIDEQIIDSINEMIRNFLVIESLEVAFDLTDADFAIPELEQAFEKIINKIEVLGGETEVINF